MREIHLASVDSRLHGNDNFEILWTYNTASVLRGNDSNTDL